VIDNSDRQIITTRFLMTLNKRVLYLNKTTIMVSHLKSTITTYIHYNCLVGLITLRIYDYFILSIVM
jgi:hypothetical protein